MSNENVNQKEWHEPSDEMIVDQSEKVLCGVLSNASMAKVATKRVLSYVCDDRLKTELKLEVERYDDFVEQACNMAKKYNLTISPPSSVSSFFVESSIKAKLLINSTTSKIAEMMIKGTIMGVIDLGKLLKHSKITHEDCMSLAKELLSYEEDKIHLMKYYL